MAKQTQTRTPPNQLRKARYATMGNEGADKNERNNQIAKGLGSNESAAKHDNDKESLFSQIKMAKGTLRNTETAYEKAQHKAVNGSLTLKELEALHQTVFEARSSLKKLEDMRGRELQKRELNLASMTGGSQSAKRARAKAQNNKKVKDFKHAGGYCGNVACKKCFRTPGMRISA